ncbi:glycosyltransferase [Melissococcus plutonius]|uniref:Glycosyl transferase, group 2 family protein n=1 Tax=Melissococcus plutonius (strain ATCC 35311 / DSM 29964 / CIP 104052 / LMG 20360 / NCIMB 702443) TaxID=940190 RepID=F3YC09_MELPT|nr:glycosyltransferase [Melissococcus plutonius]AIM25299.1 glycosyl transferase, group 2 family protein [Melissococcus plutonius S1]KMT23986.1 glycosyl transferase, group 2 family protein [Melissococcus plutonius]KMT28631.1 glycosyl transferase, group 2 family protein [Melissococcus plutonius]KMT30288.1 glycosyl transferase, group 2 family protein [Melissococcus plutonius]KMT33149.1 glycosyl transferase, group 2 family protein [Melissococcus plutonius]
MTFMDIVMLITIIIIWSLLIINILLVIAGYIYFLKTDKLLPPELEDEKAPFVSIMVPAHNEGIVIVRTVEALLNFNYPKDHYEIIVINDNSTDNSKELLAEIQATTSEQLLKVINTDNVTGGKEKSNALNIGFKEARGEFIAIYDADNTPEPNALRYLVGELVNDQEYGAAIGKFRTRNRNVNLLTRFVNIETLSFQWMAQAGRFQLFKLCTIPGTNFIVRRTILEEIGGWDEKALAEDTEISFRIYMMGYKIKFQPKAVTWEQEPQTLPVWFKQRTRWVKGNIYVIVKNAKLLFNPQARRIWFDIFYFLSVYFLLMTSLVLSDIMLILSVSGYLHTTLEGFSNSLWLLAVILFIFSTYVSITTEKGELNLHNLLIIALMYISYSQMWLVTAAYGMVMYIREAIFHKKTPNKWYKTERFK